MKTKGRSAQITPLKLLGWTHSPRNEVIPALTDTISNCGGFLLDSTRLSNLALALRVEILPHDLSKLITGIAACEVTLDSTSTADFGRFVKDTEGSNAIVEVLIHIKFVHDNDALKIETPAVPG